METTKLENLYHKIRYMLALIWIYIGDPYVMLILTLKMKDEDDKQIIKSSIIKILLQIFIILFITYIICNKKSLLIISIISLIFAFLGYIAEEARKLMSELFGE